MNNQLKKNEKNANKLLDMVPIKNKIRVT